MSNWKNLFKFYSIFCIIFIFISSSIIFNRDEVGIDSWLISKEFKSKFTQIDKIILNKNRDIIVLGILKEFVHNNKIFKEIYILQNKKINWGYKTSLNYYCNQTKNCMIMKENILNINSIKTNKKLLKEISLNRFVSEIFIENIMIYDCDNSTNLIIYNNQKNLILTCYNEPY